MSILERLREEFGRLCNKNDGRHWHPQFQESNYRNLNVTRKCMDFNFNSKIKRHNIKTLH